MQRGVYHDGSPCYMVVSDRRSQMTASVCMSIPPSTGCFWVKSWSENEGLLEALLDAGLVKLTGQIQKQGFITASECELA